MPFTFQPPAQELEGFVFPNFFGRDEEIALLKMILTGGSRSVGVIGGPGMGKTALVRHFMARTPEMFPGGVAYERQVPTWSLEHAYHRTAFDAVPPEPSVLVIDDAEALDPAAARFLRQFTERHQNLRLILTARDEHVFREAGIVDVVKLGALSMADTSRFLREQFGDLSFDTHKRLAQLAAGNPLVLALAARTIKKGGLGWDEFFSRLSDFEAPGLVGPDGRPLAQNGDAQRRIITDVTSVNDELLALLQREPELLRRISPRKFEEVVAEILTRLGYTVTLTPASGDGGVDIYAATKGLLGSFLFLVECKRYAPTRKVGVEIVRSLYGVVQSQKATAGIITTTSYFTSGAKEFAEQNRHQVHLQDYVDLQGWLQNIREQGGAA